MLYIYYISIKVEKLHEITYNKRITLATYIFPYVANDYAFNTSTLKLSF